MRMKDIYKKKVFDPEKVEQNIINHNEREGYTMKRYVPYAVTAIVACLIASVAFFQTPAQAQSIDYASYLKDNQQYVEQKEGLKKEMDYLYQLYNTNKIDEVEFFNKLDDLEDKYDDILDLEDDLKENYNLQKDVDLDKVVFSKDPKEDKKLKDIYKELLEIEKAEDQLDREEDQLKADYRNHKISKKEYLAKKRDLDKRDDELDRREDALEIYEDEFDRQEDLLEAEEEALERDYKNHKISKEEYQKRKKDIERREDELERKQSAFDDDDDDDDHDDDDDDDDD